MTTQEELTNVEKVFMDKNIAGIAPDLAMIVNRRFREYQLDPYMGSVEIEVDELEITISAYFRGREYDNVELQGLVDTIVDDISRRGLRGITGEGFHSEISGDALVVFRQQI